MILDRDKNWIKCGSCNTEFDLKKNKSGCPLCGFGLNSGKDKPELKSENGSIKPVYEECLSPPPLMKLPSGTVITDEETETWGSWLMFNDFFAPKFLTRLTAWTMHKRDTDNIPLDELMSDACKLIQMHNLNSLKGFPSKITNMKNLQKDNAVGRLVHHFLRTSYNMGLFGVRSSDKAVKNLWSEDWDNILVSVTKEGLEFARLKNPIFDDIKKEQILGTEERKWLISYLQKLDKQGYREYSNLKDVYEFLKKGNNGNSDLWEWFMRNEKFRTYVKNRSKYARSSEDVFNKQMINYSRSYSSTKISLLRELGLVRNKRNNYDITGELGG